jgi:replication-associated recombination protein RarA
MPISLTQSAFDQAHQPQHFQDLVFAEPLVREQLQGYANRSCWNHLLLHGSYGVGKSMAARVIVQEGLGTTGSGIVLPVAVHHMEYRVPKWDDWMAGSLYAQRTVQPKVSPYVIIDEVHDLSLARQRQLRTAMDEMDDRVKLILTTNYIDKIDRALRSRCDVFDVLQPQPQQWLPRAQAILRAEQVHRADKMVLDVLAQCRDVRDVMRVLWKLIVEVRGISLAPVVPLNRGSQPAAAPSTTP